MNYFKLTVPALAVSLLAACASTPVEEVRTKLAGANIDVVVKSATQEISFWTQSQQQSQKVATSGVFGAIPALVIMGSAQTLPPLPVRDSLANGIAANLKKTIAKTRPDAGANYRFELADTAMLAADQSGSAYVLVYGVGLTVVDASDGKKLTTIACASASPEHLTEQEWRTGHNVLAAAYKEALAKCSADFSAKLAGPEAAAAQPLQRKKK